MISKLIYLYFFLCLGFLFSFFLKDQQKNQIRKICVQYALWLGLPAAILAAPHSEPMPASFIGTGYLIMLAGIILTTLIFKFSKKDLTLAIVFGNVSYLGVPYLVSTYGESAIYKGFACDFMICSPLIFLWVYGVKQFDPQNWSHGFKQVCLKLLKLPPLWTILIVTFIPLNLPLTLLKTAQILKTPLGPMMLIAVGLAMEFKNFLIIEAWFTSILKLFVMPLIAFGLCFLFGIKGLDQKILVTQSAMPTMVLAGLLAKEFNLNAELATAGIAISTVLSLVTLPFWTWILK